MRKRWNPREKGDVFRLLHRTEVLIVAPGAARKVRPQGFQVLLTQRAAARSESCRSTETAKGAGLLGDFPVVEEAASQVLSLPMFPELSPQQQRCVVTEVLQ